MNAEEFKCKYNYQYIKKCCRTCKYSTGYIEYLECEHPFSPMTYDMPFLTSAIAVCDCWVEKPIEDYYND